MQTPTGPKRPFWRTPTGTFVLYASSSLLLTLSLPLGWLLYAFLAAGMALQQDWPSALWNAVATGIIVYFASDQAIFYYVALAGAGLLLGHLMRLRKAPFEAIFYSGLWLILILIGAAGLYYASTGNFVTDQVLKQVFPLIEQSLQGQPGIDTSLLTPDLIGAAVPGYVMLTCFLFMTGLYGLFSVLSRWFKNPSPGFLEFALPDDIGLGVLLFLLVSLLLNLLQKDLGSVFLNNASMIFGLFATLQGFALLGWFAKKRRFHSLWQVGGFVALLFLVPQYLLSGVFLLGMIDTFFHFRRLPS